MDMSKLRTVFQALTADQLRQANRELVHILRFKDAQEQQAAARQFNVGDVVEFQSKGRMVRIRVDRFNTKSLSGTVVGGLATWRVAPSLCHRVAA
jgi:hypothetical protein